MKKFKSLMLAALASAALAAPSFADGHLSMGGEIVVGMNDNQITRWFDNHRAGYLHR